MLTQQYKGHVITAETRKGRNPVVVFDVFQKSRFEKLHVIAGFDLNGLSEDGAVLAMKVRVDELLAAKEQVRRQREVHA